MVILRMSKPHSQPGPTLFQGTYQSCLSWRENIQEHSPFLEALDASTLCKQEEELLLQDLAQHFKQATRGETFQKKRVYDSQGVNTCITFEIFQK